MKIILYREQFETSFQLKTETYYCMSSVKRCDPPWSTQKEERRMKSLRLT